MAAQPQDRDAEQDGAGDGEERAEREADAERPMELRHGDRRAIGAEAIERGIAEGHVAGEAAEDVPGLGQRREEQRVDAVLDEHVVAGQRQRGKRDEAEDRDRPAQHL